ncbi:MAG: DUF1376 domain-containing protein [Nitrospira sp. NTP1]|nr:DUF1376 domain-containing protein [Nitrospira sp. NTP1]
MNRAPAFQFYPNDWLSSPTIALMSPAEEGAYIRLLSYAWADPDCSLPDDDTALSQLSRLGEGWFKGGSTTIRKCFKEHPEKSGRLVNLRLLEERKKQDAWRQKSRIGGLQSGKSRTLSGKGGSTTLEPPDSRMLEANTNSSSSSSSSKEEEKRAGSASPSPAGGSSVTRKLQLSDEEFMAALRQNPAYKHIDIDHELGKMDAWLLTPRGAGKKKTRQRVLTWLNRAADERRPMAGITALSVSSHCKDRQHDGRRFKPCTNSCIPGEEYCSDHLPARQRIAAHLASGKAS